jgi:hypothetical protein
MIGGPITSGHRGQLPCGVFHFTTGKRAAFQARAQSFRYEEVLVRLRLYAFRTSDEPEACHRFVVGHQRALAHYGVKGLASAKPAWLENPHVFVLAAEDEGRAMLAGIRLGLVANSSVGRTRGCADPILRFVGLRKSEADQQHLVLLAHCPRAGEAKALS